MSKMRYQICRMLQSNSNVDKGTLDPIEIYPAEVNIPDNNYFCFCVHNRPP